MAFDEDTRDLIFKKTDGVCHLCRKRLARKNYGKIGARGAWEVEHSNARANGGTDHLNNLYAACISCNRSKGKSNTRAARSQNGFKAAPFSQVKKTKNVWTGAALGSGLALLLVPPPIRIAAVLVGALLGGYVGEKAEPE